MEGVQILLDEPAGTYYSGQLLTGRVHIQDTRVYKLLYDTEAVSAINITYLGQAAVDWTEYESRERSGSVREANVHYQGRETYFNVTESLFGGNGSIQLPPGAHTFPFQFQIPPNVPSSFKSSSAFKGTGEVSYSVIVQIVYNPSKMKDITKEFQVVAPLDLNKSTDIVKNPLAMELEGTVSCFCTPRTINVRVSLPCGGFCPGQNIPFTISTTNDAKVEVKGMLFALVQREWYRSQTPASEISLPETVLASTKSGPVLAGSKQEVTRRLKVPDMIAPNLRSCAIIDVEYYLKVKVKISGCNHNMDDTTELAIGLVPLATSESAQSYVHPCKELLPQVPLPDVINMPQTMQPVVTSNLSTVKFDQISAVPNFGFTMPYQGPDSIPPYPGCETPYPVTNAQPVSATPHPISATPYPVPNSNINSATPYPNSAAPHSNSAAPYPISDPIIKSTTANPNSAAPYPISDPIINSATANPNSAPPYPNSTTPYPMSEPYLNSATPYPNSATSYPNSATSYPNSAKPYPMSEQNLSSATSSPMPKSNLVSATPYPMPNPDVNSATPYPMPHSNLNSDAPYPVPNPNLNSAIPYPMPNPDLHSDSPPPIPNPYPTMNSALRTGTLGFITPHNATKYVPYPIGTEVHSPLLENRENTAPSAPAADF